MVVTMRYRGTIPFADMQEPSLAPSRRGQGVEGGSCWAIHAVCARRLSYGSWGDVMDAASFKVCSKSAGNHLSWSRNRMRRGQVWVASTIRNPSTPRVGWSSTYWSTRAHH